MSLSYYFECDNDSSVLTSAQIRTELPLTFTFSRSGILEICWWQFTFQAHPPECLSHRVAASRMDRLLLNSWSKSTHHEEDEFCVFAFRLLTCFDLAEKNETMLFWPDPSFVSFFLLEAIWLSKTIHSAVDLACRSLWASFDFRFKIWKLKRGVSLRGKHLEDTATFSPHHSKEFQKRFLCHTRGNRCLTLCLHGILDLAIKLA